jgi:RNA polymerase sigma-70 factor, ECF subfamily
MGRNIGIMQLIERAAVMPQFGRGNYNVPPTLLPKSNGATGSVATTGSSGATVNAGAVRSSDVAAAYTLGRLIDPDVNLVRQHLAGDNHAFETLFKKYQTPIFNLVTRMVHGEDAYDLTQDVFLKALKSLKSFRGDAKFSTWLYTIARHTCLNHIRHKKIIEEESIDDSTDESPGIELVDKQMNVAKLSETRELQRIVDNILAQMPQESRMLLILRDFEQLSYDEISHIMELSIVNVKSKIHRARQAFKKRFMPYIELLEGYAE